jgi:hypothetical protein
MPRMPHRCRAFAPSPTRFPLARQPAVRMYSSGTTASRCRYPICAVLLKHRETKIPRKDTSRNASLSRILRVFLAATTKSDSRLQETEAAAAL